MIRQLALCNQNQGQNYCEKETTEEAIQGIVLNTLGQAETPKVRQSKINSRWVAGPIGQTNRQPSV